MKVIPNINYICECGCAMYNKEVEGTNGSRRTTKCVNRECREYNISYPIPIIEIDPAEWNVEDDVKSLKEEVHNLQEEVTYIRTILREIGITYDINSRSRSTKSYR